MRTSSFVGRGKELSLLELRMAKALDGQGQVCFISGDPGAGKTALAYAFAEKTKEEFPDLLVAVGQCNAQTGIGDAYLPFKEALESILGINQVKADPKESSTKKSDRFKRVLATSWEILIDVSPDLVETLVPGVKLVAVLGKSIAEHSGLKDKVSARKASARSAKGDSPPLLDQAQIFEQYTQFVLSISKQQPLLLILDDLHWSDSSSISLLFHLARRIQNDRVLIVGTYRPEEVSLGRDGKPHPLEDALNELMRYEGEVIIDLSAIDAGERRFFVDALLDTEPNNLGEDFRQALYTHTDGHPLFAVELLRSMQESGDLLKNAEGQWIATPQLSWENIPARVEGVVRHRLSQLDEEQHEILSVGSVVGIDFTAQIIAQVLEANERKLLRILNQQLSKRHRLIEELGEELINELIFSKFGFTHAMIQQYLYADLSQGERRLLHAEVGKLIELMYGEHTTEIAIELAHHFTQAGIIDKAVKYAIQVGDQASRMVAYDEAIRSYEMAVQLLRGRNYELGLLSQTLMKLGVAYQCTFDFNRAQELFEEAFNDWNLSIAAQKELPPPSDVTFTMLAAVPYTLDPVACAGNGGGLIASKQVYENLVEITPDLSVVPCLAKSWEIQDEGRKYVFLLDPARSWSDGTPLTAGDFVTAWKRVLDPKTPRWLAAYLFDVRGAEAYFESGGSSDEPLGIQAKGENRLEVSLIEPVGYFLHLAANPLLAAVPEHIIEAKGASWAEPGQIVGIGAFEVTNWVPGVSIEFARRREYSGFARGNLQRCHLIDFTQKDPSDWPESYEADEISMFNLWGVSDDERVRLIREKPNDYHTAPALSTSFIVLNTQRPPLDDVRVRKALLCGFDRLTLMNILSYGLATPALGGLIPQGIPAHTRQLGLQFDPAMARGLLSEAGYPGGDGFPKIEFAYSDSDFSVIQKCVEMGCGQWSTILEIPIEPLPLPWEELKRRRDEGTLTLMYSGWIADLPDPDNILRAGPWKLEARWSHDEFDRLITKARTIIDTERRLQMYQEAEHIMMDEVPVIPLIYNRTQFLQKPWFRYQLPLAMIFLGFKDIIVDPEALPK